MEAMSRVAGEATPFPLLTAVLAGPFAGVQEAMLSDGIARETAAGRQ